MQNIDVDIPRDALTVITGVSGSGKSSLAFDTLYAEGQRQYIDSLSAYARQFLDQIPRPDVDSIDGLAPTLAIDQKPGSTNARSTVATVTEIYDYLRLLYARVGTPHCVECGSAISQQSSEVIRDRLAELPDGTKLVLMAPMIRGRRGEHRDILDSIRVAGLIRARVDGEIHALEDIPPLAAKKNHTIDAVVDRLVIREDIESRLTESISLALRLSGGMIATLIQNDAGDWDEAIYNTAMACADCGNSFEEIEPRTFSFNSPYGACPSCDGIGKVGEKDRETVCPVCQGGRLRAEALAVTIDSKSIVDLTALPLSRAAEWLGEIETSLSELHQRVARPICIEVVRRLTFLQRVGVSYLTLDRAAHTLSGGELQRVRLATSIGSGLVGVCYVLDEPSIGLHPADHDRLIQCIRDLQQQGNTLVVVEHDEATMWAADVLIDIGPGAGSGGGQLIGIGTPQEIAADKKSLTGQYLSGTRRIPIPSTRRPQSKKWLTIKNVRTNNLKDVTLKLPLEQLIGVSGVSGSGKSSLINDTLYPALAKKLDLVAPAPGPHKSLLGSQHIDKLIVIDQAPIGRSPRSCPATYAGVLDEIRKVFAATREAKTRGFKAGRFSFNSADGRCELCKGHGAERIEMNFLSDLFVTCTRCGGRRFNRQTLQVRFKDASIADVLDMTVDESVEFFQDVPKVLRLVQSLQAVGLGYIHLGQSSTTLSGGEAQRIKLGTELAKSSTGSTLYLLDEPTTGLHFADVERLLGVLQQLVDAGNTVIVIEHNFDLLAACDWIVDLGPTGGEDGGYLLAEGPPETIADVRDNATGKFLKQILAAGKQG
ncbi:excinuclease ABC subunit UvrA [Stieleria marina]|uniref:excinuclease ABC subunit UvrA n=1 Tax=Stieleria marina TaxID=1930275 RepID=UPI003AF358D4